MSDSWPLVSIVTPSYNQGRFIEATIKSVVDQGYPNLEYIIIDGGSTDGALDIIKQYAQRYPCIRWISEKDSGQSNAINKGLKMAKGEIVAWLNSDDTYHDKAIFSAVAFLQTHPDISLVYGDANIIDKDGNFVTKFPYTEVFDLWRLTHISDYIMQPTTFWRRSVFDEVGYLDEGLYWTMDWDFWIRVGQRLQCAYNPVLMANNREYGETKTSSGGGKRLKEIQKVMSKYCGKKYPPGYVIYALDTYSKRICGVSKFIGTALRATVIDKIIFKLMASKPKSQAK